MLTKLNVLIKNILKAKSNITLFSTEYISTCSDFKGAKSVIFMYFLPLDICVWIAVL